MTIIVQRGAETAITRARVVDLEFPVTNDNSFMIYQTSSSDTSTTNVELHQFTGQISGEKQIRFNKISATATGTVSYYVVSCDANEFIAKQYPDSGTTGHLLTSGSASTTVDTGRYWDPERTMVIGYARPSSTLSSAYNATACVTFELDTDNRNVLIQRNNTTSSVTMYCVFYVIQWHPDTGVKVHTGEHNISGNIASKTAYATNITDGLASLDRSWLFVQFRHNTNGLERISIAATLDDTSNIHYQRYNTTTSFNSDARWYILEFPENSGVQCYHEEDTGGTVSTTVSVAMNNVDVNTYQKGDGFIVNHTNSCQGNGNAVARNRYYHSAVNISTFGGRSFYNSLTLTRGYAGQPTEVATEIIYFTQYNYSNDFISFVA